MIDFFGDTYNNIPPLHNLKEAGMITNFERFSGLQHLQGVGGMQQKGFVGCYHFICYV